MQIQDLKNKLVAILGYGVEGQAITSYLLKHGIKPVLFDQRPWSLWNPEDQKKIKQLEINFIFGTDTLKELAGFDIAFKSPGVKITDVKKSNPNLQITSQTIFFFENCPAEIIGITGTKGKGTTSSIIAQSLIQAGKQVYLTGNIGYEQPLNILDDLKANDKVVYELSSFQLQDLKISPHIAVVLMTAVEHLDHHASETEYVEAKSNITKFQNKNDFAVINLDFPNSRLIGDFSIGKKYFFSRKTVLPEGCYLAKDKIIIPSLNFELETSALQLRGVHNIENVSAAILASYLAGCTFETIKETVENFKGLEHRLEFIEEKNGIKFYNDSFSTTPETAIAAINSFTEPEILILGGSSKNSNFSELANIIIQKNNLKAVILVGEETTKIKNLITEFQGQIFEGAKNMPEILTQVKSIATRGDVVLLSPACASFDMFQDYKDRGNQFKRGVLKW